MPIKRANSRKARKRPYKISSNKHYQTDRAAAHNRPNPKYEAETGKKHFSDKKRNIVL